ncbi:hypothetical protein DY000_02045913 [Brassica cretica]|uniref:DUF1985 domain-containing protein n=1 Tax=Brassica cretica TaxID=69181 RepID=A0ABQ7EX13_BRACR|nr:hypothetical protein DY000_02045913 [Brassica cretica]
MSEELPKRLFKEGEEPRVTQINNNCRIDYIIRKFQAWLPKELDVVKKDPVFYQIFKLHENGLGYSARVIHSFLCRELTKDKEAVKKWRNADRIRLIYLAIILCVVLARDEKANIPLKYITVVMDLDKVQKYPWGVAAYDLLCKSIAKNCDQLKEKTTSYVLDGFSYALQIWAMEAVPKIGKLCGKKLDKGFKNSPRCINWMGAAKSLACARSLRSDRAWLVLGRYVVTEPLSRCIATEPLGRCVETELGLFVVRLPYSSLSVAGLDTCSLS